MLTHALRDDYSSPLRGKGHEVRQFESIEQWIAFSSFQSKTTMETTCIQFYTPLVRATRKAEPAQRTRPMRLLDWG
jgi:hypothetical protein